ncbi:serine hydrolase domain-containing protein [Aureibacter tunicatorum]|uniref:CubicO group peptidase (Beta-lactamase class C family) n=1 Tax=Aureibacter tunicatorum TaxID=866807 RepID=A0AAE3XN65_9BACT|nr:serine hydrolase [Aureibacter tunicatorum]MDR6238831.1 CubicO group peptidase (beta-lactamase class C family) [Aureibacter tunicatorum]BDD05242.1 hypothetical protein AUTU_27250 [Aureibacter tunicatorum]
MKALYVFSVIFFTIGFTATSQDMSDYNGDWEGRLQSKSVFDFEVEILNLGSDEPLFRISNDVSEMVKPVVVNDGLLKAKLAERVEFVGYESEGKIRGFVASGLLQYHVVLDKRNGVYFGELNALILDQLSSDKLYLSVENGSGENYQAYPIFSETRFTGTWCADFKKNNQEITFQDFKTGLNFKGILEPGRINMSIYLGDEMLVSKVNMSRSKGLWEYTDFNGVDRGDDSRKVSPLLIRMDSLINNNSLENTHSVLISRNGKLVFEKYYNGYTEQVPHDTRSMSKSVSSAVMGILKDQGFYSNTSQSVFDFVVPKYLKYRDSLKNEIDLQSLLTMSSGLDAIDFGIDSISQASEDKYQSTFDWFETILKARMLYSPNVHANYGTANPALLGLAARMMVEEPLNIFMDKYLFEKLDISNYVIQTDREGYSYFGGGMYLSPRDMLKFGEMYLNEGVWGSERIISKEWIHESFKKYLPLENAKDQNMYGYLWWHGVYEHNDFEVATFEARGAGGQYVFVIPKLDAVVVITSANFRNGKVQQPERIFEEHILPFLLNEQSKTVY